jgi:para-nitrobenzyl esterase
MKPYIKTMITSRIMACILLFGTGPMYAANINTLEITTQQGLVNGQLQQGVGAFYGIPYAKNPFVKERRFQAPQAYGKWQGVLDATNIGQPVPQPSRGRNVELVGKPGDLTLNIWMPKDAIHSDKKLPVMVWLPGGAFIREDAGEQVYNGTSFAKNGVIIVTVNYRVGVDGFMHLQGAPDNRGILDQIMALEWVNENISSFGGDPKKVTLFGQSAGAESVAILLGIKKAQGLFQKAIMQSPPMQSFTQTEAARITKSFADKLSVPATIEGIASVPFTQLVSTVIDQGQTITNHDEWGMIAWGGTAFLPVVDNKLITGSPMQSLEHNADPSIPVIVGSTDQEARLYLVPNGAIDNIAKEEVSLFINDLSLKGHPAEAYANKPIGESYVNLQSDYTFRMPALHIAEHLVNNGNTVWHYNFSWFSPAFGGRLGPAHFVDVPFTFNTILSNEAKGMVGENPPESLAQAMHDNWIRFAKSDRADWTPYNLDTRPTMRFDTKSQQVDDPEASIRELWRDYPF